MAEKGYLEAYKNALKETPVDEYEEPYASKVKRRMREPEEDVYRPRSRRVIDDD